MNTTRHDCNDIANITFLSQKENVQIAMLAPLKRLRELRNLGLTPAKANARGAVQMLTPKRFGVFTQALCPQ